MGAILVIQRSAALIFIGLSLSIFFGGAHIYELSGLYAAVWSDTFWTLSSFGAGVLCIRAARHSDASDANAWWMFAAACFSWFAGMLIWSYFELVELQATPFPAVSDVFFMLFAPLFGGGLWLYGSNEAFSIREGRLRRIFNLGLVASASLVTNVLLFLQILRRANRTKSVFRGGHQLPDLILDGRDIRDQPSMVIRKDARTTDIRFAPVGAAATRLYRHHLRLPTSGQNVPGRRLY